MENFKVTWNALKSSEDSHFHQHPTPYYCKSPTKNFRPIAEITIAVKASLRPNPNLSWKISKFHWKHKNCLSMTIFNSDLLHGTMHDPTRCHVNSWTPWRVTAVMSSPKHGPSLSWKIWKFCGTNQNWHSRAISNSNLLHCAVQHPPNFRPTAEILKELEQ